ncbi:MAG: hypothetical protein ACP5T0_05965 [Verrucomicrobiia bacterium]
MGSKILTFNIPCNEPNIFWSAVSRDGDVAADISHYRDPSIIASFFSQF